MKKTCPVREDESSRPILDVLNDEYLSLSTNHDIPLGRRLTRGQRNVLKSVLLGGPSPLTLVTGTRCSGRTSALAIASVLHVLRGDGNVVAFGADQQRCKYSLLSCVGQWISTISPQPGEWKFSYSPSGGCVFCHRTGNAIHIKNANSIQARFPIMQRNASFVWFDDLEYFESPQIVLPFAPPHYCRVAVNYQIQGWQDPSLRVVRWLKPHAASTHRLSIIKKVLRPEHYIELMRHEEERKERCKRPPRQTRTMWAHPTTDGHGKTFGAIHT